MSEKMKHGLSCEKEGESNDELFAPRMLYLTGPDVFPFWAQAASLLAKAAAWGRGEYTLDDLLVLISERQMQLWLILEGEILLMAGVTRIVSHPRRKICEIYALAGCRMAEMWGLFSPQLLTWANANGADEVQVTCRPEVSAKLQLIGFEPIVQVLRYTGKDKI